MNKMMSSGRANRGGTRIRRIPPSGVFLLPRGKTAISTERRARDRPENGAALGRNRVPGRERLGCAPRNLANCQVNGRTDGTRSVLLRIAELFPAPRPRFLPPKEAATSFAFHRLRERPRTYKMQRQYRTLGIPQAPAASPMSAANG